MMVLDISTSMWAQDLKPDRIEAAKAVAQEFIASRPNDNIGLTIFAGEAFTQCPLTIDHAVLLSMFRNVSCQLPATGMIDDGTAIGMGLANAISRLKDSKAKSKVIILLTDQQPRRHLAPHRRRDCPAVRRAHLHHRGGHKRHSTLSLSAARRRSAHGQHPRRRGPRNPATNRGHNGRPLLPGRQQSETNDIDKLEKTKLEVKRYDKRYEAYMPFAIAALLSLLVEFTLRTTWLRRIP